MVLRHPVGQKQANGLYDMTGRLEMDLGLVWRLFERFGDDPEGGGSGRGPWG